MAKGYMSSWLGPQLLPSTGASTVPYLTHNSSSYCILHIPYCAGGTNLQLPSWTAFKEVIRSNNWAQLTMLGLPRMGLYGPIGPLTYYMPQLTMLDLSSNQLTGIIPADMSSYSGFRQLNLANNTLYGGLRRVRELGACWESHHSMLQAIDGCLKICNAEQCLELHGHLFQ